MDNIFRLRSEKYMRHIRSKPCLICGGYAECHHLTFAQLRAMQKKNGDQYCVPLCHAHHMELHSFPGGERTFWSINGIQPLIWAAHEYDIWSGINTSEEP